MKSTILIFYILLTLNSNSKIELLFKISTFLKKESSILDSIVLKFEKTSLACFFFFSPSDYGLNYCRFGLNLGLIMTKPSESADVTVRESGNKGWNESRNDRGIE